MANEETRTPPVEGGFWQRLKRTTERTARLAAGAGAQSRRGLTLVELAIVLLVLGIIMGIVFANIDFSITDKAVRLQVNAASVQVRMALQEYQREVRQLEDRQSLAVLAKRDPENPGWRPKPAKSLLDPWKNYYVVRMNDAGEQEIWSLGADKAEGGEGKNADFCITDEATWPAWLKGTGKKK